MPPMAYPALRRFLQHSDVSYHKEGFHAAEVRKELLRWYDANRRRLPWRGDAPPYNGSTAGINTARAPIHVTTVPTSNLPATTLRSVDPYAVWVSEIMLQQTRVEAVIPYWLAWMEAFPTVESLAAASEDEVNARWAGLGFYRRARMLHEGSRQVVNEFDGKLPTSVEGLMRLKGVGRYTAGAIASICYGIPAPIVDGNVLRVISRLCAVAASPKDASFAGDGQLSWQLAEELVTAGDASRPGDLNQAVMELGATLCAPTGSGTDSRDPLRTFWKSTAIGREAFAALKAGAVAKKFNLFHNILPCHTANHPREIALVSTDTGDLEDVLAQARLHECPVCKHGATQMVESIRALAKRTDPGVTDADAAASYVHGLLPLAPPKKVPSPLFANTWLESED